jgi:hypothetical protein
MRPRLVKALIALYPDAWKSRYGEEFRVLLEERPARLGIILNVIVCALRERAGRLENPKMSKVQHSLGMMVFAALAAPAAGANLYFTIDDTPLAAVMQTHSSLSVCWTAVCLGALLALTVLAALGLPAFWMMFRFARNSHRLDVGIRLAMGPCALAAVLVWIAGVLAWDGWRWAPWPWAISADWPAGVDWPTPGIRWALSLVTLVLLGFALVGGAVCLRQAITRCEFPPQWPAIFGRERRFTHIHPVRAAAVAVAAAAVAMWAGAGVFGVLANSYLPGALQARFGLLNSSVLASWLASMLLLAAAAAAGIRGARWAGDSREPSLP